MAHPLSAIRALEPRFAAGGTVSIWCGPPGGPPVYERLATVQHYAASTIKLPILVAAYRMADAGRLDLDLAVKVHDAFRSAVSGSFRVDRESDNDDEPWQRLGEHATLRWLGRRMIVRSSNLATNLLLDHVGLDAVQDALAACGASGSALRRYIGDRVAAAAGIENTVTARGLAVVLGAVARGRAASATASAEMIEVLDAQEYRDQIPAGIPAGVPVASKGGWVEDIRHDAALIRPAGLAPYVLVVCTTASRAAVADGLLAEIAAASWADRRTLGSVG